MATDGMLEFNGHRYAGHAYVAAYMARIFPGRKSRFSRQNVYTWWSRRDRNGFPGKHSVRDSDGTKQELFDLDEVVRWYGKYSPSVGGRPRKDARQWRPEARSAEELAREHAA